MSAFDIIFSFAITWGVGLGLPSIVRYGIYRRALFRDEALGWAVGLTLANFVFFILLGSQSKTHIVLFFIGFISYRLLQRVSGPWDKTLAVRAKRRLRSSAPPEAIDSGSGLDMAEALPPRTDVGREAAPVRRHLGGWHRIFIVLLVLWFSAVGLRVSYELSGKTYERYLVERFDPPAEFDEGDIVDYEHHILLELGVASAIAKERRIDEDRNAPIGSLTRRLAEDSDARAIEKRVALSRRLLSRGLPELTSSVARELSVELSVPEQALKEKESLVRQLLMLRLRQENGILRSMLLYEVFGAQDPVYTVNTGSVLVVALGPVMAFLLIGCVVVWIKRGFRN